MESSKRPSLIAVPLIAITLLVAGMTQRASAAHAPVVVKSATTGVTAIDQLMDRVAQRAAERRNEQEQDVQREEQDEEDEREEIREEDANDDVDIQSLFQHMATIRRNERINARRNNDANNTRPAAPAEEEEDDEDSEDTDDNDRSASGDIADQVFDLVNAERARQGLPAYAYNNILENSAEDYSAHMNDTNCFSHTACGSTLKERMHASGYYKRNGRSYSYGENIARGQDSAAEVMEDWMNSSSHRAAILSTKFKEIGIGRSGNYWTQHFGAVR